MKTEPRQASARADCLADLLPVVRAMAYTCPTLDDLRAAQLDLRQSLAAYDTAAGQ